jgi:hypothetical protein
VQKSQEQASQRNNEVIASWRDETWPSHECAINQMSFQDVSPKQD